MTQGVRGCSPRSTIFWNTLSWRISYCGSDFDEWTFQQTHSQTHTQCSICGLFVVPIRHDSQRPELLFLGRNFLNGELPSFGTDRSWRKSTWIRLKAPILMLRTPAIQQKNSLQGLPAPCFLWVNHGSPIQGRNLHTDSAYSRHKYAKNRLLDLPAEKYIKPVYYILYDLIEGVTLKEMSVFPPARSERHNHPYVAAHLRRVDRHGG
jgi:hypothetical protein